MDHPKCATCVHYARPYEWDGPFGFCDLIQVLTDKSHKGILAAIQPGGYYASGLEVLPNFYCPMHSDLMPELIAEGEKP